MSAINGLEVFMKSTMSQLKNFDTMSSMSSRNSLGSFRSAYNIKDRVIASQWKLNRGQTKRHLSASFTTSIIHSGIISVSLKSKTNITSPDDSRWGYSRNEFKYNFTKAMRDRRKLSAVI